MSDQDAADCLLVILGGTGDLAGRKLLPALYRLDQHETQSKQWGVLGVSRSSDLNDDRYRDWAAGALADAGIDGAGDWCRRRLHYCSLGGGEEEDYRALSRRIAEVEEARGLPGNRAFYLSLPAPAFPPTVAGLGNAGLARSAGWTRLVVEKPFGHDLDSGLELNEMVHRHFDESQVYRIDHYLGKETVQNLMVYRFGNSLFEDLWNRDRIESVQITVAESLGVEGRAAFFERTGSLRDIVQNHLAQIVCLTAMEVPAAYRADAVRYEKLKVLQSIRPIDPCSVVWAQYAEGTVDGRQVPGYLQEEGISSDSRTETYVAMKLEIDTWRWQGVPFYIRTGKRLDRKLTQIAVNFRRPPVCLFESMGACLLHQNELLINLQPDEGFTLRIDVKAPGSQLEMRRIPLQFRYADAFEALPDAYETLLLDLFSGDQTLFVHADEVAASWRLFDPLLASEHDLVDYAAGSTGPAEADRLLARHGHQWVTE